MNKLKAEKNGKVLIIRLAQNYEIAKKTGYLLPTRAKTILLIQGYKLTGTRQCKYYTESNLATRKRPPTKVHSFPHKAYKRKANGDT